MWRKQRKRSSKRRLLTIVFNLFIFFFFFFFLVGFKQKGFLSHLLKKKKNEKTVNTK
ncbi:hypothetical protein ACMBCN_02210 [Candidatus Liberibacter asiaticus]